MRAAPRFHLAALQAAATARLELWETDETGPRIWLHDHTVWSRTQVPELTDRLGWLHLPAAMADRVADLRSFAAEIVAAELRHAVLLGMGGSSLAPETFQAVFGNAPGHPELIVLDSTHPRAVEDVAARIDPARTVFIVSSKSGTTVETMSFFRYFWDMVAAGSETPGRHFVAVTDPGSALAGLAVEREFRRVFLAPPDVGGRYSALSVFGLVPAALIGVDVGELLATGGRMAALCGPEAAVKQNPGLVLGSVLGEAARAGRDKLTVLTSPGLAAFPPWIEQLVAESTGKSGTGIVPIVAEPPLPPAAYGDDRLFVSLSLTGEDPPDLAALEDAGHPTVAIQLDSPYDLGAELFRFEFAVAAAGAVLGIHPFDQPDVQLAKELATRAMAAPEDAGSEDGTPATAAAPALEEFLGTVEPGDYLAIQAFIPPDIPLGELQRALGARTGVATVVGYGPRFLHSTGQLHKGGPARGVFLQLADMPVTDVPVPETDFTFGRLIHAQAAGDLGALRERDRRVLRVDLGTDPAGGLEVLLDAVRE